MTHIFLHFGTYNTIKTALYHFHFTANSKNRPNNTVSAKAVRRFEKTACVLSFLLRARWDNWYTSLLIHYHQQRVRLNYYMTNTLTIRVYLSFDVHQHTLVRSIGLSLKFPIINHLSAMQTSHTTWLSGILVFTHFIHWIDAQSQSNHCGFWNACQMAPYYPYLVHWHHYSQIPQELISRLYLQVKSSWVWWFKHKRFFGEGFTCNPMR